MEPKKKIKITIAVLAVLLALSLAALGGTLIYNRSVSRLAATVAVPDNLITSDDDTPTAPAGNSPVVSASEGVTDGSGGNQGASGSNVTGSNTSGSTGSDTSAQSAAARAGKAVTLALYNKHPEDNTAFQVGNMFPGDAETNYYCVRVSYRNAVTVHFKATVRPGFEKLAEVLKIRVTLLSSGKTLYDGLMSEMPESVKCTLTSNKSTTDELYYEITAYLDTSVGNEYQNKDLIADFHWWVEERERGNLINSPKTGDNAPVLLWTLLAAATGLTLLLVIRRRKENEENG